MFEFKPDFEEVAKRFEAWWNCEIIDRPVASVTYPRTKRPSDAEIFLAATQANKPSKKQQEERLDPIRTAQGLLEWVSRDIYCGDALPVAYGSVGPETIPAFFGCPIDYTGIVAWSEPILKSWEKAEVDAIRFDPNSFYFRRVMEMTDALLEVARGKFLVAPTNFLGAIDTIAALRDPQQLALDLITNREDVVALADHLTTETLQIYDIFHNKLSALGMPSVNWLEATCKGKFYIPCCDFSCMISGRMFEEIVVPQILREVRHMDRNMYHLDGERALRHLDPLLEIPEIQAYQWVMTGYGSKMWRDWIPVYQRMQKAGKAFCVPIEPQDIEEFGEHLRPEGVWLVVNGVGDQDEADAVLKTVTRWR